MDINHPIGNKKIYLLKLFENFLQKIIFFFISFFLRLNPNNSEIIISRAFYAPWKDNKNFIDFYKKIKELTLLDIKRSFTLWYLADQLKYVNGVILDIGCLKGGAGFLMCKVNKQGNTYLFDTFEGPLEEKRYLEKKVFIYKKINEVKKKSKLFHLKKIEVFKNRFPKNLPLKFKKIKIKLCHIDVNTYKSTRETFNYVKNKMIKGGVIVFDDYGIHSADSIKKFILNIKKKEKKYFTFIYNFMGQCLLIRK